MKFKQVGISKPLARLCLPLEIFLKIQYHHFLEYLGIRLDSSPVP